MKIKNLKESTPFQGKVNADENTIKDICLINSVSKNNRIYSDISLEQICQKADGVRSMIDHCDMFGGQSVTSLLGEISNTRKEGSSVYGDLKVLESSKGRDLIFEISSQFPHLGGFSISAQGKFSDEPDSDGRDVVTEILNLHSVDFVHSPATTSGVFESEDNQDTRTKEEIDELVSLKVENKELKNLLKMEQNANSYLRQTMGTKETKKDTPVTKVEKNELRQKFISEMNKAAEEGQF